MKKPPRSKYEFIFVGCIYPSVPGPPSASFIIYALDEDSLARISSTRLTFPSFPPEAILLSVRVPILISV